MTVLPQWNFVCQESTRCPSHQNGKWAAKQDWLWWQRQLQLPQENSRLLQKAQNLLSMLEEKHITIQFELLSRGKSFQVLPLLPLEN